MLTKMFKQDIGKMMMIKNFYLLLSIISMGLVMSSFIELISPKNINDFDSGISYFIMLLIGTVLTKGMFEEINFIQNIENGVLE